MSGNEKTDSQKNICFLTGLAAGISVNVLLRIRNGDEGNLLIYSAVFLGSFLIMYGLLRLIYKIEK